MRPALAVAAGAVLLALALLATAPAPLLDRRIDAFSAGRVRIANAAGTLWHGSGELVLLPAGTRLPLFWRLEAWPLVRGEVQAAIGFDVDGAPSARLTYGADRFEVRDLDVSLPVESVVLATRPTIPFAASGNLALHAERLVQRSDVLEAQLAMQWTHGSVPGLPTDARIDLGDLRVDLTGHGAEISGPLHNSGGEVEISGQVSVAASGAVRLDVHARPRGGDRAERVAAALAALGAPDGQGGYRLIWAGAWR